MCFVCVGYTRGMLRGLAVKEQCKFEYNRGGFFLFVTIISKGFYLDTLFLHINYEHASLLNFVSQLKENFSRKRSYFEEFGCFDYGEEN